MQGARRRTRTNRRETCCPSRDAFSHFHDRANVLDSPANGSPSKRDQQNREARCRDCLMQLVFRYRNHSIVCTSISLRYRRIIGFIYRGPTIQSKLHREDT